MSKLMMQTGLPRFRVVKDKLTGLYRCHLCSYKSVYGSSLRSHFAVHSNARPYGCDMCSYEAKRLPDLKKHKILKHIRKGHGGSSALGSKSPLTVFRDPASGLYRCQHCSYQSDNARCVRSHLAVHSHLRPYACDMCSYEAKRSSDLSKHKIIKHGRIPSRRNKTRTQPAGPRPEKLSQTPELSSGPASTSNNTSTSSPSFKHNLISDLDHCDVLSDLDYSLMSPTRAALEALRRCNMEPLDMFNEYSHHDSFQQNPVFPEPESEYGKKSIYHQCEQSTVIPTGPRMEEPRGNYVSTTMPTAATYNCDNHIPKHNNEEIVFIKPEPPDDYFDHMNCQLQNQSNGSYLTKLKRVTDHGEVGRLSLNTSSHQGSFSDGLQTEGRPDPVSCTSLDSQEMVDESVGSTSDQRPTSSQQTVESVSTSVPQSPQEGPTRSVTDRPDGGSDRSLIQLERRNVSGSTLIRPFLPSTPTQSARVAECERVSADCSQSRESGYSSPGSASVTPISQPNLSMVDPCELSQGDLSKGSNTRKSWSCPHCDIMFFDGAMYFMHMGLHNTSDPWRCNMCATKFYDVYGFTSHFVNGHS